LFLQEKSKTMTKKGIVLIFVVFVTIILKTTILGGFAIKGVKPDIVLIIIIIFSNFSGSFKGELLGFFSGFLEDLLSMSPLGFNAFINSIIGFLSGITVGKIFLNPLIITVFLVFFGTLLKSVLSFFLLLIFVSEKAGSVYTLNFLFEILFNIIITPFIYFILRKSKLIPIKNDSIL